MEAIVRTRQSTCTTWPWTETIYAAFTFGTFIINRPGHTHLHIPHGSMIKTVLLEFSCRNPSRLRSLPYVYTWLLFKDKRSQNSKHDVSLSLACVPLWCVPLWCVHKFSRKYARGIIEFFTPVSLKEIPIFWLFVYSLWMIKLAWSSATVNSNQD